MKCPNCSNKISFFSKGILIGGKSNKVCPNCSYSYKTGINFRNFLIAFIPLLILSLVLQEIGVSRLISNSISLALLVYFAMDIKNEKLQKVNFSAQKGCLYSALGVLFFIVATFAVFGLLSAFS